MTQRIIAAVDDMFFASKIRSTAEHLGIAVEFKKNKAAAVEAARQESPAMLIADLHSQRCDPLAIAREFKSDDDLKSIPLVGFFSHVDTALQSAAQQAGFDRVMPRSAFSNNLARILSGEF
jgi:PleD family two-component response regulator